MYHKKDLVYSVFINVVLHMQPGVSQQHANMAECWWLEATKPRRGETKTEHQLLYEIRGHT